MIRLNDAHAIKLIAEYAKIDLGAKIYCIAHYDESDILTGGVLCMGDNGYSMEIHAASFRPNWGRQELLWTVFNYVFTVRKIKKLFVRIPEANLRSRRFCINLGFKPECIINDVFPGGEGYVVMGMYEGDCRFLSMELPKVKFASIDKTNIISIHEYSQGKIGD